MNRRELLAALALALAGAAGALPGRAFADESTDARDLWLYGLPIIEMATTRARHLAGGLRLNTFQHARQLSDFRSRTVTSPNNDTLYSIAWLDLTQGPVSLTVPATGDRYWSAAFMDMYSNNNAVLGLRTTGGGGGRYLVVGPGQTGSGPGVVRCATPHAWLLVRILTDGAEDLPATHAVQDGFRLSGPAGVAPPAFAGRGAAPVDYFASLNQLLASDPPPATDGKMLARLKAFRADGPGVAAGIDQARNIARLAEGRTSFIQGWTYTKANLGDFDQDYLYRALVALSGLAALPVAEAMYLRSQGERENSYWGDGLYRLAIPTQMPVNAFWSLSMYEQTADGQRFFAENPIGRYAIGDRTKGLKRNADGSLDVWIARTDPGGERSANWLPAPKTGPFNMTMRLYLPRPEVLDGRWRLPAIEKA
ncbi:MAG: DUF1254 domain-containing protein [Caulobacter sp.]|nr:DUF1254 domain-containing protein [Caulobacter sp.]